MYVRVIEVLAAQRCFDKVNGASIIVMRAILCFIIRYTFFIRTAFTFYHVQDGFCQEKELSPTSLVKQFLSDQYSISATQPLSYKGTFNTA